MAMRGASGSVLLGLAVLVAGCADETPPRGCEMREIASLPVLNNRGPPVVRAAINGTPVAFIVDTGSQSTTISTDVATKLGLSVSFENHHIIMGTGGSVFAPDVTVRSLQLGSAVARNVMFVVAGNWHATPGGLPLAGLFGGDFLANYDVEFDLPAHRVSLYLEHGCGGHLRPWETGDFYRLPFELENQTQIDIAMKVNGHPVSAVLDSGASRTMLDLSAGRAGGATNRSMAADRRGISVGIDGNPNPEHVHRFDSLDIGSEHIAPVKLAVGDLPVTLLGADFLRGHRVWISYAHEVVYVQRVMRPGQGVATVPDAAAAHVPVAARAP